MTPRRTYPVEGREASDQLRRELARVIVGQQAVSEQLAICLPPPRHAWRMGVPGLAKTLLVSKLAEPIVAQVQPHPAGLIRRALAAVLVRYGSPRTHA